MSNEVNNFTVEDLLHIDSRNPLEVEWWSKRFDVPVQQLRMAIKVATAIAGQAARPGA